jgi:LDH2 family malate/lactate/ureidoglycolate dehydrogenase
MSDEAVLLPARELLSLTQACFEQVGVASRDAQAVAEVLIDANLHGVSSHGFQRVPIYMRRVLAGLAGGTEELAIVAESGAVCRMDARHALGPAAAIKALDHAVALAGDHGVGLVAMGQSTHFGAAGYYVRRAANAGCVAIVMTNATKRMAPYGAAEAFLGTNALAIGIPLERHDPFVLDMATSVGAQGKITQARQLGTDIPPGLALDAHGRPTTDAAAALAGSLLPVGGAKGSGLALAITLLTVTLAGADADDEMASLYNSFDRPQNTGHIFIGIDPARAGPLGSRGDDVRRSRISRSGGRRNGAGTAPEWHTDRARRTAERRGHMPCSRPRRARPPRPGAGTPGCMSSWRTAAPQR